MAVSDNIYTPDDYNQNHVLKVPGYFSVILLYMLRYPVLYIIPNIPMMKNAGFLKHFAEQQFNIFLLITAVPALLVAFALFKRTPQGEDFPRKIWVNARILLLFAVGISLLDVMVQTLFWHRPFNELLLVFAYLDGVLFIYLWRSKFMRDIFSEFPAYDPESKE